MNNGAKLLLEYYIGSRKNLVDIYLFLKNNGLEIYGLNSVNNIVKYSYISSINNLIEYWNNPGDTIPSNSIKNLVHPPSQLMYIINTNFEIKHCLEILDTALYPIKSCDLNALQILDKLLVNDSIYRERRSRVKYIIVEECTSKFKNCFCGSTETGPFVKNGFDLAYGIIDNKVVFKPGSDKGYEIINYLNLSKASIDLINKYLSIIEKTRVETKLFNTNLLREVIDKEMSNTKTWINYSSKCIGCGNCNAVCPTCFCNEIVDVIVDNEVYRYRKWIGCLLYIYGLTAGYHYRSELYMRFRHFILHKFLFKPIKINTIGCTGCGRCITWCPMNIDFIEIYREFVEKCMAK